ncbi:ELWxxDGT repeat protein [Sanyastnella coralliicola]|uniref:ELWxxDGT repeat protein n=1 Tax=Sanyastnella coralliicola TaxID=3069118 RepID=UPI0027B8CD72|nr:ELWxxDGT repeat protein [Longitalea sp. SCSIO 12813]
MKRLAILCTLLVSFYAQAQEVELVKNINTTATSSSHDPDPGVKWNDLYIYSGWSADGGREPWVTDGTEEGTQILLDILIGNGWSDPEDFSATSFGVFFRAQGTGTGEELYFTDGTPQGTILLGDFFLGGENGGASKVFELNGLGYFTTRTDEHPNGAIWTTDGTPEGTQFFKAFDEDENVGFANGFVHNETLYLSMLANNTGQELYKTDGTVDGTVLVKDIESGSSGSGPTNYFVYNDEVYFTCWNSNIGNELWKTDGTTEGTNEVDNVNPGSSSAVPNSFLIHDGLLYFSAQSTDGRNLWVTDGTAEGTTQLSFIDAWQPNVSDLVSFNGEVYFVAEDDDEGYLVWKSDGTTEGTEVVYNIYPDNDDDEADHLHVFNGDLYFRAEGPDNGNELWVVDGETLELNEWDLNPGDEGSFPFNFKEIDGKLYFGAADDFGYELWVSDGTEEGTEMLINVNPEEGSLNVSFLEQLGENIIWKAKEGSENFQLYVTDGTPENTSALTSLRGEYWSRIREMTIFDGYLFFNAEGNDFGQELWRSDGTPEGTFLYQDVNEGPSGGTFFRIRTVNDKLIFDSTFEGEKRLMVLDDANGTAVPLFDAWSGNDNIANIEVHNGEAYFSARDTDDFGSGDDLWKTDGTEEGTVKVYDFGTYDISPEKFFSANDQLWFFGEQYGTSSEWGLYKSDGTSEGTEFVQYHNLSGNNWGAFLLEGYQDLVLYTVFNTSVGRELYFSDGTSEGSGLVQSIAPGSDSPNILNLLPYDGVMYFTANNGANGTEIWRTDGTAIGTSMVTDILEGEASGVFDIFDGRPTIAEINGQLIFGGATEIGDYELFISDGTAEGSQLLLEINPYGSASPHNFFTAADKVYFTANDGIHGFELWKTDGTPEGTVMVDDINEGNSSSFPREYIEFGDHLYFQAYAKGADLELFRVDQRCLIAEINAPQLEFCVGDEGEFAVDVASAEGNIDTYEWNFSDETTLEGESVTKLFSQAGEISVELTMNTDQGCQSTLNLTVMVNETPVVSFFGPDEPLCLSSSYSPDNQTTGFNDNTEWLWEFGDDASAESQFPSHNYEETGVYEITLTASNGQCSTSLTQSQEVYAPEIEIETIIPSTCFGSDDAAIVVSATSILGEVTYSIDGTNYQSLGEFLGLEAGDLEVYFLDDYGCEISEVIDVPEPDPMDLDLSSSGDDGTTNGSIQASAEGGDGTYLYSIDGGANTNSTGIFEGLAGGTYTVWVTDGNGCTYEEEIDVEFVDSVKELGGLSWKIYPNPAQNEVYIEFNSSAPKALVLVDMLGRECWRGNVSSGQSIDLSVLRAGIYLMVLEGLTTKHISVID